MQHIFLVACLAPVPLATLGGSVRACCRQVKCSKHCIWSKQILTTLAWLRAFIDHQTGTLTRVFTYNSQFGLVSPLEITCDASIWGIGGWLSVAGAPIAWFSDIITKDDEAVLPHKRGEHEGQQTFESLSLLVATRLWSPLWRQKRVRLCVRSDNRGALSVFSNLKSAGVGGTLIAREYALDLAECCFQPLCIQHVPGVANATADALSRRTDPQYAANWSLPLFLSCDKQATPPRRDSTWWKTLAIPAPP